MVKKIIHYLSISVFCVMSQTLTVSGSEFIPASEAGKRFGYTREYILLLAREGKISAQKVGSRWFVDPHSVAHFCETTKAVQIVRRERLRRERKAELVERQAVDTTRHRNLAVLETLVIVGLGSVVGLLGFLTTTQNLATTTVAFERWSTWERVAVALYELVSPRSVVVTHSIPVPSTPVLPAQTDAIDSALAPTPVGMVVAPAQTFSTTSVESIRASFSDPVSVAFDPSRPDTGIITPHFRGRTGESYRFLIVPVATTTAPSSP
jgi:hypothetical protein